MDCLNCSMNHSLPILKNPANRNNKSIVSQLQSSYASKPGKWQKRGCSLKLWIKDLKRLTFCVILLPPSFHKNMLSILQLKIKRSNHKSLFPYPWPKFTPSSRIVAALICLEFPELVISFILKMESPLKFPKILSYFTNA